MLEVTSSWFSWIDRLPVWAQILVAIPIMLGFMAFFLLAAFGIKWELQTIAKYLKRLRDE